MIRFLMLLPLLISVSAGVYMGTHPDLDLKSIQKPVLTVLGINLAAVIVVCLTPADALRLNLYSITDGLTICFHGDLLGKYFALLSSFVWLMAGIAACEYLEHDPAPHRFFCFYLITEGILLTLCFTGNLFSFYIFFELTSLCSMPLVLHDLTREAITAAMKYLFYSMGGAFLSLFGFFLFASRGYAMNFTPGGCLTGLTVNAPVLPAVFLMIAGYGVKAGMFPTHGWLPTAHPVAPAPASAVLSGVITKAGVLGVIRCIYYVAGPDLIRGTWVQVLWMSLALVTVFMGSMMAYREQVLKKRLAYSSVSQVSYVMFGLSLLHPVAFLGALLHVVFHSLVKDTLFIAAGSIIHSTGRTKVSELAGTGRGLPITMWCFTLVSVTLIGIPPTSAFISKWYLAVGALESGIPLFQWLGPVVLLLSALLTAGYLLTLSIRAFLPGTPDEIILQNQQCHESGRMMTVPMLIMTVLAVFFGIWPAPLMNIIQQVSSLLF